jgi:hypothetical protein
MLAQRVAAFQQFSMWKQASCFFRVAVKPVFSQLSDQQISILVNWLLMPQHLLILQTAPFDAKR